MIRTGIVGLGFMGQQHFAIHQSTDAIKLVGIADKEEKRRQGEPVGGNIGEAKALDFSGLSVHASLDDLLKDDLELVDICTPTFLHADMAVQALEAGKHVIVEKPMALTAADCGRMIDAAKANGKLLFVAQCIRFWPAYEKLSEMVKSGALGRVVSARFTRQSSTPVWSQDNWLMDTSLSGGALTDLHIHDADFILSLFGKPTSVSTQAGNVRPAPDKLEHVLTQYFYDGQDMVVWAEGGWGYPDNYPFEMAFQVLGENGALTFSTSASPALTWYPKGGDPVHPEVSDETGYQREFAYFAECVEAGRQPDRVLPQSAQDSVALITAERESAKIGRPVKL